MKNSMDTISLERLMEAITLTAVEDIRKYNTFAAQYGYVARKGESEKITLRRINLIQNFATAKDWLSRTEVGRTIFAQLMEETPEEARKMLSMMRTEEFASRRKKRRAS